MTEYSDDPSAHPEAPHLINRSNWLRAAVMGANDGIVSVSSLIVGMATATGDRSTILLAGIAGLAAGAMSMAAGEFVSVHSQTDIERADIERERDALERMPEQELAELAAIFESRGMTPATAIAAAREVTAHDALGAHVREELGLHEMNSPNPLQAALASGVTFSVAAALPLLAAVAAPAGALVATVLIVTVAALALLGALGARTGGAPMLPATLRVAGWGVFAMVVTAGVGHLFGAST